MTKERHSLTLDQRRALRRWANAQTVRPSHKACIEWFESQYGQAISQSTVSHSLSPKYARLDGDPQLSGSRLRFGNWPDVEKLVLLWHQGMVASGRQPSNEELADKAKSIFTQLPRYKDESAPEFSPGWIHRFKKRYGLLIRRQRRHGTALNPADDISYLADAVPRFLTVAADTSPATIKDAVLRVVGVEASLSTCARVRDQIVHRLENPDPTPDQDPGLPPHPPSSSGGGGSATSLPPPTASSAPPEADAYGDDDPEMVLQNALRQLQQEEAEAEAEAAAIREERDRVERGLPPPPTPAPPAPQPSQPQPQPQPQPTPTPSQHAVQSYAQQAAAGALATPVSANRDPSTGPRFGPSPEDLTLTPIAATGPMSSTDRPVRCPFCVNQRMLRTIKEAVEHLSTHVVV